MRRSDRPARTSAELRALVPQVIGAAGFGFCLIFWAGTYIVTGTGAIEPLFVTTSGGLLAIGLGAEAVTSLKTSPPAPPPLPEKVPADASTPRD